LDDSFATGAGQTGAHDAVYDEPSGDVFQLFRDVLAQSFVGATAFVAITWLLTLRLPDLDDSPAPATSDTISSPRRLL